MFARFTGRSQNVSPLTKAVKNYVNSNNKNITQVKAQINAIVNNWRKVNKLRNGTVTTPGPSKNAVKNAIRQVRSVAGPNPPPGVNGNLAQATTLANQGNTAAAANKVNQAARITKPLPNLPSNAVTKIQNAIAKNNNPAAIRTMINNSGLSTATKNKLRTKLNNKEITVNKKNNLNQATRNTLRNKRNLN